MQLHTQAEAPAQPLHQGRQRSNHWQAGHLRPDRKSWHRLGQYIQRLSCWTFNCEAKEMTSLLFSTAQLKQLGGEGFIIAAALVYHMGLNLRTREGVLEGKFLCDTGQAKLAKLARCSLSTVKRKLARLYEMGVLYYFQRRECRSKPDGTVSWKCYTNIYALGPQAVRFFWSKKRVPLIKMRQRNTVANALRETQVAERMQQEKIQACSTQAAQQLQAHDPEHNLPEPERWRLFDVYQAELFRTAGIQTDAAQETLCSSPVSYTIPSSKEEDRRGSKKPPCQREKSLE